MASVITYVLWNLLWPIGLIAIVVVCVLLYRRWDARTDLDPAMRRRTLIAIIAALVLYVALRPYAAIRFAQYLWPPNALHRAGYDYFAFGQAVDLDEMAYVSRLEFPDSTRLRAADDHSWLEGETRARVTAATTDVPELLSSRSDLEPVNPEAEWLVTADPWDPLWWAPRPDRADEVWRAAGLQVIVYHGWFGRSTVFIYATGF